MTHETHCIDFDISTFNSSEAQQQESLNSQIISYRNKPKAKKEKQRNILTFFLNQLLELITFDKFEIIFRKTHL